VTAISLIFWTACIVSLFLERRSPTYQIPSGLQSLDDDVTSDSLLDKWLDLLQDLGRPVLLALATMRKL